MTAAVHTYGASGNGTRMSAFEVDGIRVTVTPACDAEKNEAALDLACRLARHDDIVNNLRAELDSVRAMVCGQRRRPARLLGTGYVRFLDGKLWLLNRRGRGFGEFGMWMESWDDLFRRFDVRVTGHGEDEHGPWWAVEPTTPALTPDAGRGEGR